MPGWSALAGAADLILPAAWTIVVGMTRPRSRAPDEGLVGQAVEAASEALSLDEIAEPLVSLLLSALGGSGAAFFTFDLDGRPRGLAGTLAAQLASYDVHRLGPDPLLAALRRAEPRPRTILIEDVMDYGTLRASPAFHEFYRPLAAERLIGLWPTSQRFGDPDMIGLIICRPWSDRAFVARERRLLESALPALRGLVARDRRARQIERERELMSLALRQVAPRPTFVFDRQGALLWTSPAVDALGQRDPAGVQSLGRQLGEAARRMLRERRRTPEAGAVSSIVTTGDTTYEAELSLGAFAGGADVIVATVRDDHAIAERVLSAARRFNLSKTEGAVLECLAQGLDNKSIGRRLFVSESTVKTHVRQILDKLAVESRTQAALLAHAVLPRRPEDILAPPPAGRRPR